MATGVKLWKDVLANSQHETAASQPIPLYCEWLRLLVGRALALAHFSNSNKKYKYLILGIDLPNLKDDESINLNLIKVLEADLIVLQTALKSFKQSLSGNSPIESPEIFLRSFSILTMLRLPQESKDWVLTDEGLTIINWGLTSGRLFFDWNESQFEQIKKDLLQRIRTPRSGNVTSTGSSRNAQEESRQQTKLNTMAHKSVPSEVVPVKVTTNPLVISANNTKQPISWIRSNHVTPIWLLALLALCFIIIGGIMGAGAFKLLSNHSSNKAQIITELQILDDSSKLEDGTNANPTTKNPKVDENNQNSENWEPVNNKSSGAQNPDHSDTSPLGVPSDGTPQTAVPQGHSNQQPESPKSPKADHPQSQELSK